MFYWYHVTLFEDLLYIFSSNALINCILIYILALAKFQLILFSFIINVFNRWTLFLLNLLFFNSIVFLLDLLLLFIAYLTIMLPLLLLIIFLSWFLLFELFTFLLFLNNLLLLILLNLLEISFMNIFYYLRYSLINSWIISLCNDSLFLPLCFSDSTIYYR